MNKIRILQCGALATATSALGWTQWHGLFKPLTMAIALVLIAFSAYSTRTESVFDIKSHVWMATALAGSLAGDVFLMFEGFFIPGLVSFLVAHLCYLAVFKRGQRWFPHRGALAATMTVGAAMYGFLWTGGLPAGLRGPVAAYVLVIALMAAQAMGRAVVLRDKPSLLVAAGAGFFMLSDSLLAINRFVQPLPLAQLWVLASYYAAQVLILEGWLRGRQAPRTAGDAPAGSAATAATAA